MEIESSIEPLQGGWISDKIIKYFEITESKEKKELDKRVIEIIEQNRSVMLGKIIQLIGFYSNETLSKPQSSDSSLVNTKVTFNANKFNSEQLEEYKKFSLEGIEYTENGIKKVDFNIHLVKCSGLMLSSLKVKDGTNTIEGGFVTEIFDKKECFFLLPILESLNTCLIKFLEEFSEPAPAEEQKLDKPKEVNNNSNNRNAMFSTTNRQVTEATEVSPLVPKPPASSMSNNVATGAKEDSEEQSTCCFC